jgi:hypothetical protein
MIEFTTSTSDSLAITRIVRRAVKLADDLGLDVDPMELSMDLTSCHANGCPLDLAKLEHAAIRDFGHDVFGIRRHINRKTGEMGDCFLPRCALPRKGV